MTGDSGAERLMQYGIIVIPAGSALAASVVMATNGPGPGILVLAGGALAGAIAFVWSSLRTLGDTNAEKNVGEWRETQVETSAEGAKVSLLRTLKDLQHEHEVGKLNDEDYEYLSAKYRGQLKEILRDIDVVIKPHLAGAEALAAKHLASKGLVAKAAVAPAKEPETPAKSAPPAQAVEPKPAKSTLRRECGSCSQLNEVDAVFCKKCGQKLLAEGESDAQV